MTGYFDLASHLLNDRLANAESESSASPVDVLVFLEVAEVYKKFVKLVTRNAGAEVLNVESKVDVRSSVVN